MLLLNISDIHFKYPFCNSNMDPNLPYRTMLTQDASRFSDKLGPVDAILVAGDIAYHGQEAEYEAAFYWLQNLSQLCQCPLEHIYVVPGNHDVDRSIIRNNVSVRNVQNAIINAENIEKEFHEQFLDAEAGRHLFASINAYNRFAARFSCQVYASDKLFWSQDLPLDDSTTLRLYGLTSTLLSSQMGQNDMVGALYLSPFQTVLNPEDGVVNLVICHHPTNWFKDQDAIEDAICGRAAIQLFGHSHRQRIVRESAYIRFSSAAVNPNRNELGWEPGYNIIQLSVVEENGNRYLDIQAHLRVWQTGPDGFRAKIEPTTGDVFLHRVPVHGMVSMQPTPVGTIASESENSFSTPIDIVDVEDVEAKMAKEPTRNLVLRFWGLASSERREIALELGLISQDEITLPEAERYGRALERAGKRGLLEKLGKEIERRELANE